MLDDPTHQTTAFLTDISNAFNAKSRAKILSEIYATPTLEPCWRIVHWTYGSESTLRLTNGTTIKSQNGVKQGETLGSLMFAVSMHRMYQEAANVHPDTVRLFCVMDDATFVGPAQHVIDCVARFVELLQQENLHMNFTKCAFLSHKDNQLPPAVSEFLQQRSVPIVHDATMLLGAPIGWDANKMKQLLAESYKDMLPVFDQLLHPALRTQEAMSILRICTVPTLGYLLRVIQPDLLRDVAANFDRKVLETAQKRMELPSALSADQIQQLQLKLRHGGFGLASSVDTSPIAYSAAFLGSVELLSEPTVLGTKSLQHGTAFRKGITQAISRSRDLVKHNAKAIDCLPPQSQLAGDKPTVFNLVSGAGHMPVKIQRTLSQAADSQRRNVLISRSNNDKVTKARLLSCAAEHASAWLTAVPSESATRMSDRQYSMMARMRLGLPPTDDEIDDCVCNTKNGKKGADSLHQLSCNKARKLEVNLRHDMVKTILNRWARRVGCASVLEPQSISGSQQRGDLFITTPQGKSFLVDVTIVQPACPTWLKRGSSKSQLSAANAAAKDKHHEYDEIAKQMGAKFVPIAAEVFGAINTEAIDLFKQLASFATVDTCPWSRTEALNSLISSLAIAIQVGNTRIIDRVNFNNAQAGLLSKKKRVQFEVVGADIADDHEGFGFVDDSAEHLPVIQEALFDDSGLADYETNSEDDDKFGPLQEMANLFDVGSPAPQRDRLQLPSSAQARKAAGVRVVH